MEKAKLFWYALNGYSFSFLILYMIKIFKAGVFKQYFWNFKKSFRSITPVLHHSITPIINNLLWTTDNPIDKEKQFKAVHNIWMGQVYRRTLQSLA